MKQFVLIALLLSFQHCKSQSSNNDQKLSDNYSLIKNEMTSLNMSNKTLSKRQSLTFDLLKNFMEAYPLCENTLVLIASAKNLSLIQYDSLLNFLNPALKKILIGQVFILKNYKFK